MSDSWSRSTGQDTAPDAAEVAPILAAARVMMAEQAGMADAAPSYETMRWLFDLARQGTAAPTPGGVRTEPLVAALDALMTAAGRGPLAALLLGTLRSLPLDPARETRGLPATPIPLPSLFVAALGLLLDGAGPGARQPDAAMVVLQGLDAAAADLSARPQRATGACFLVLATQLCLALRLGAAPRHRGRLLRALAGLAADAATAVADGLAEAEARTERIRAMLNDPAQAMRLHYLVPRRSMTAEASGALRKGFAREDALASAARDRLSRAEEAAARLHADHVTLEGLERLLLAEAGALPG